MDNKFFSFFDPVLKYIDKGSFYREPFRFLYAIIAVLNLLFPIFVIIQVFNSKVLAYLPGKAVFAVILIFLLLIFLGIMSFNIWMNRQQKVKDNLTEGNEFIAIPVISHFIQTLGEWIGFYLGIGGCVTSLFFFLFGLNDSMIGMLGSSGMFPMGTGLVMIIIYPIIGFLIVVSGRLIAELYRALASIANNTQKLLECSDKKDAPAAAPDDSAAADDSLQ